MWIEFLNHENEYKNNFDIAAKGDLKMWTNTVL